MFFLQPITFLWILLTTMEGHRSTYHSLLPSSFQLIEVMLDKSMPISLPALPDSFLTGFLFPSEVGSDSVLRAWHRP